MTVYDVMGITKADIEAVVLSISRYYITYKILKRNGKTRRIDAPQDPLKMIQRTFMEKILYRFRAHPIAHGFVHTRSPITNANIHVGKKYILTVDIKNFFNSIQENAISRCLEWLFGQQTQFTWDVADCVLLSKMMCFNGGLPQGSPASPVMSNLVCLAMDKRLADLAAANDATVTRYADDIALSSDTDKVLKLRSDIYRIIQSFGLVPNRAKTKFRRYFQRQQITGIVVNQKLGAKKEVWRKLRARLHNLSRDNKTLTKHEAQQVRGVIEWIKSLNPHRGDQLMKQFSLISVNP